MDRRKKKIWHEYTPQEYARIMGARYKTPGLVAKNRANKTENSEAALFYEMVMDCFPFKDENGKWIGG